MTNYRNVLHMEQFNYGKLKFVCNHVNPSESFKIFFLNFGCDQKRSFLIIGVGDIAYLLCGRNGNNNFILFSGYGVHQHTHESYYLKH